VCKIQSILLSKREKYHLEG